MTYEPKISQEIAALLDEIDVYCAAVGIAGKTLTRRVLNNSKLYDRLKAGRECLPSTMGRLRRYMRENPPATDPTSGRERNAA